MNTFGESEKTVLKKNKKQKNPVVWVWSPSQTLERTVYEQLYLNDSYTIPPAVSKAAGTISLLSSDLIEENMLSASVQTHTHSHTHARTHIPHQTEMSPGLCWIKFPAIVFSRQPFGGEHTTNGPTKWTHKPGWGLGKQMVLLIFWKGKKKNNRRQPYQLASLHLLQGKAQP